MRLELTDEEAPALLNLLTETIENDRFPLSQRVQVFRDIRWRMFASRSGTSGTMPTPTSARNVAGNSWSE
jgi:hypothetical protein